MPALGALGQIPEAEDLSAVPGEAPLLVVEAGRDERFPAVLSADLVARLAACGAPVDRLVLSDAEHLLLPSTARHEALAWSHGLQRARRVCRLAWPP